MEASSHEFSPTSRKCDLSIAPKPARRISVTDPRKTIADPVIHNDQLRLIFMCCLPALATKAQVALTPGWSAGSRRVVGGAELDGSRSLFRCEEPRNRGASAGRRVVGTHHHQHR
jgi:hypothetical protein